MRMASEDIVPRAYIPDLEKLCEATKDKDLYLRSKALLLRAKGKTLSQINEYLGIAPSTVKFYNQRLKEEGTKGLIYHGQSGNRKLLTKEQWKELKKLLTSLDAWNVEDLPTLLSVKLGVEYADPQSYVQILEKAGYIYEPTLDYYITPEKREQLKDGIKALKTLTA